MVKMLAVSVGETTVRPWLRRPAHFDEPVTNRSYLPGVAVAGTVTTSWLRSVPLYGRSNLSPVLVFLIEIDCGARLRPLTKTVTASLSDDVCQYGMERTGCGKVLKNDLRRGVVNDDRTLTLNGVRVPDQRE